MARAMFGKQHLRAALADFLLSKRINIKMCLAQSACSPANLQWVAGFVGAEVMALSQPSGASFAANYARLHRLWRATFV
jgi:hypothetical protein